MIYGKTLIDRALSPRPPHLLAAGRNSYRPASAPTLTREIRTFTDWYDIEQIGESPLRWNPRLALDTLKVTQISWDRVKDQDSIGHSQGHEFAINPYSLSPVGTLFHELAHIALGHTYTDSRRGRSQPLREVEAETTGFVSMAVIGAVSFASVSSSAFYVDHYLKQCEPVQEASIRAIGEAALTIIRAGGGEP